MSDRVGRKKTRLAGCGLTALTYVPICMGMKHFGNPGRLPVGSLSCIRETNHHRIDVERHA